MARITFKVGDRVRLKRSRFCIPQDEVDKEGVIKAIGILYPTECRLLLDGSSEAWSTVLEDIELAIQPGEQLLFEFME